MTLQNMFGDIALDATLTDGTQLSQIVNSTGTPAEVTAGNALKVDASDTTQPVSIADPVSVTGPLTDAELRATDVPVTASSLPLPTGAATEGKQPSLGTAGTASSDVLTVQGIASMTALKVDGSAVTQPVSGTVTANAGTGTFAVSASSLPLPTGAATAAKQDDGNGHLQNIQTALGGTLSVSGPLTNTELRASDVPVTATSLPLPSGAATSALQGAGLPSALVGGRLDVNVGASVAIALAAGAASIGVLGANSGVDIGDVTINNASLGSAVNIQDGGNSITVDNGGTFAIQDTQAITDNAAFTDGTSKVYLGGYVFDETAGTALTENDAAASRIDSKRAQVHVIEDATTRGQRMAVSAIGAIANEGDVAHDGADSGKPTKMGAVATTDLTALTNVASGDRTNLYSDITGRQIVSPYCGPENLVKGIATLTTTGNVAVIAAGAASVRTYITSISVTNTSATATRVDIKDGTTTIASAYLAPSGGGHTFTFPTPLRCTAATAVNAALGTAATDVRCVISGFQLKN